MRLGRLVALLVLTSPVVVLAGCEHPDEDAMAVGVVDGQLEIVVCDASTAISSYVEQRMPDGWHVTWDSSAQINIGPEDPLRLDQATATALAAEFDPRDLSETSHLEVRFLLVDERQAGAGFYVPDSGIPDDAWLRNDETVQPTPCEI